MDLLYLPLFLGEGGCGRPREKVALLLAGRTESFRGLMGGGGGWGRDTLGLRFFRLSSIVIVFPLRTKPYEARGDEPECTGRRETTKVGSYKPAPLKDGH